MGSVVSRLSCVRDAGHQDEALSCMSLRALARGCTSAHAASACMHAHTALSTNSRRTCSSNRSSLTSSHTSPGSTASLLPPSSSARRSRSRPISRGSSQMRFPVRMSCCAVVLCHSCCGRCARPWRSPRKMSSPLSHACRRRHAGGSVPALEPRCTASSDAGTRRRCSCCACSSWRARAARRHWAPRSAAHTQLF